mgnify:CR=1 FL=1|tara:strand:+ start:32 stop:385 length:354 start_codon:yes stop_codon:yes gene_type:complete
MTTSSAQDSGTPILPVIQGGQEVYDAIMGGIEPDLLSTNIDTLDEKYAGESEEEQAERMERYKKAFIEYQKQYAEYRDAQKGEIRVFSKSLMGSVEQKSDSSDASAIDDIESAISNA